MVFKFIWILDTVYLLMPIKKNNKTGKKDLGLSHNKIMRHHCAKQKRREWKKQSI